MGEPIPILVAVSALWALTLAIVYWLLRDDPCQDRASDAFWLSILCMIVWSLQTAMFFLIVKLVEVVV